MYVILDTNVLVADFLFESSRYRLFSDFINRTKSSLILPQVVFEEACALYNSKLELKKEKLEIALNDLSAFIEDKIKLTELKSAIVSKYNKYRDFLDKEFQPWSFEIIPYNNSYLPETVRRSILKIKPFSKGKEFRDTIIWLTILDFLRKNRSEECIFISFNTRDFGAENQLELHPSLKKELEAENLKMSFYSSFINFIESHASKIAIFTKDWIINHLDWKKLNKELLGAVETIHCTYYYALYEQTINLPWDYYYQVKSVEPDFDNIDYFVYEKDKECFTLELHVTGIVIVDYFVNNEQVISVSTEFFTETRAECTSTNITWYSGLYYEEESGLNTFGKIILAYQWQLHDFLLRYHFL